MAKPKADRDSYIYLWSCRISINRTASQSYLTATLFLYNTSNRFDVFDPNDRVNIFVYPQDRFYQSLNVAKTALYLAFQALSILFVCFFAKNQKGSKITLPFHKNAIRLKFGRFRAILRLHYGLVYRWKTTHSFCVLCLTRID